MHVDEKILGRKNILENERGNVWSTFVSLELIDSLARRCKRTLQLCSSDDTHGSFIFPLIPRWYFVEMVARFIILRFGREAAKEVIKKLSEFTSRNIISRSLSFHFERLWVNFAPSTPQNTPLWIILYRYFLKWQQFFKVAQKSREIEEANIMAGSRAMFFARLASLRLATEF